MYKNELLEELENLIQNSGDCGCSIWRTQEDEYKYYELLQKIDDTIASHEMVDIERKFNKKRDDLIFLLQHTSVFGYSIENAYAVAKLFIYDLYELSDKYKKVGAKDE